MSEPLVAEPPDVERRESRADQSDTLTGGLALLFALTILQRLIGLGRNVLFCRVLTPEQLGYWNLAFSFLMIAAPLTVLGLPGALGRYVEHYRQREQLRAFLRRISLASAVLCGGAILLLSWRPGAMASLVFGDAALTSLALATTLALAPVIAFNFLVELFTALRQVRIASTMQFLASALFALLGLSIALSASLEAEGVVASYAGASVIAAAVGFWQIRKVWTTLPASAAPLCQQQLWQKLLPFAVWIWLADLLANLFFMSDRYMILHFGGFDSQTAAAMVGQYHASCIVPTLIATGCGLLSGVLLPYLAQDWEAGSRRDVSLRLNLTIKLVGLSLCVCSAAFLLAAPWVFRVVLGGKYDGGLVVLPWTLAASLWMGMALMMKNYLWCAEQGKLSVLSLLFGLTANISLNAVLLPRWGLLGAVLATAAANAMTLALVSSLSRRLGRRRDLGLWLVAAAPAAIGLGAAWACALVVAIAAASPWLFSQQERDAIAEGVRGMARRRKAS